MCNTFLREDQAVSEAAAENLHILTAYSVEIGKACMMKMLDNVKRDTAALLDAYELDVVERTQRILQCLANVSASAANNELAIQLGVLDAVLPLLQSSTHVGVCRLAASIATAVTVQQCGKRAAIKDEALLTVLCNVAMNEAKNISDMVVRTNANTTLRNIVEHPEGLRLCGQLLLAKPAVALFVLKQRCASKVITEQLRISASWEDRASAIALLDLLSAQEGGAKAAYDILNIIPMLIGLTTHAIAAETAKRVLVTMYAYEYAAVQIDELGYEIESAADDGEEGVGVE
jgi:hypothetical protein